MIVAAPARDLAGLAHRARRGVADRDRDRVVDVDRHERHLRRDVGRAIARAEVGHRVLHADDVAGADDRAVDVAAARRVARDVAEAREVVRRVHAHAHVLPAEHARDRARVAHRARAVAAVADRDRVRHARHRVRRVVGDRRPVVAVRDPAPQLMPSRARPRNRWDAVVAPAGSADLAVARGIPHRAGGVDEGRRRALASATAGDAGDVDARAAPAGELAASARWAQASRSGRPSNATASSTSARHVDLPCACACVQPLPSWPCWSPPQHATARGPVIAQKWPSSASVVSFASVLAAIAVARSITCVGIGVGPASLPAMGSRRFEPLPQHTTRAGRAQRAGEPRRRAAISGGVERGLRDPARAEAVRVRRRDVARIVIGGSCVSNLPRPSVAQVLDSPSS